MKFDRKKLIPLLLLVAVVLLDQVSKMLIVRFLPIEAGSRVSYGPEFFGDFLRIVHVSNTGIAFSIGQGWGDAARGLLFRLVPVVVLAFVMLFYFRAPSISLLQRWAICGIVGGGIGNLIDRFFRAEGVVDFIDVKFYGLFGFERWPTFNIADASVVVCGVLLVLSFVIDSRKSASTDVSEGEK